MYVNTFEDIQLGHTAEVPKVHVIFSFFLFERHLQYLHHSHKFVKSTVSLYKASSGWDCSFKKGTLCRY